MIRTEKIQTFEPGIDTLLYPYSAKEYFSTDAKKILDSSEIALAVYVNDLLISYAGIVRYNFCAKPYFWFLLTKHVKAVPTRVFKRLSAQLPFEIPPSQTYVEASYKQGRKFAEFCGFKPTDNTLTFDDKVYQIYEVC